MKDDEVRVLKTFKDVQPFLSDVQRAADSDKAALGFFTPTVYEYYARRELLYVAVTNSGAGAHYVGHLLFDCRHPRAKVLQIYCDRTMRRDGIATRLLDEAMDVVTSHGFMSFRARVAEDLVAANKFWEKSGFYVQGIVGSRSGSARQILIRVRELKSPQLFEASGLCDTTDDPLGLAGATTIAPPIFLLDLNVLFDFVQQRVRHELAQQLFRVAHEGALRLAISDEMHKELARHQRQPVDPMIELVGAMAQFKTPDNETLLRELAATVLDKEPKTVQSANDQSDLRHLATAITNKVNGFITSDEKILNAGPDVLKRFGVQILSPDAFQEMSDIPLDSPTVLTAHRVQLSVRSVLPADEQRIRDLLEHYGLQPAAIAGHWLPFKTTAQSHARRTVWAGDACIGYIMWSTVPPGGRSIVRAVLEDGHPEATNAARLLFRSLIDSLTGQPPQGLTLDLPLHQSVLREEAQRVGFFGSERTSLTKAAVGSLVHVGNWRSMRESLAAATGIKLPEALPTYRGFSQQIQFYTHSDGNCRYVPLGTLETYLAPVLFCLSLRPAVITPIERRFSEPLLGHAEQLRLLSDSAALDAERIYLSGPLTQKHLTAGTIMLFYESGSQDGRQAIVAAGRVTQVFQRSRSLFTQQDLRRSVLTPADLDEIGSSEVKTVSVFDNVFTLPRPVPLSRLRSLGCGDGHQLITTHPIEDAQLTTILREGFAT